MTTKISHIGLHCSYKEVLWYFDAINLGNQYVIKSDKAVSKLKYINTLYVCKSEKEEFYNTRLDLHNITAGKVRMARIEYKGKGNYIEEILK